MIASVNSCTFKNEQFLCPWIFTEGIHAFGFFGDARFLTTKLAIEKRLFWLCIAWAARGPYGGNHWHAIAKEWTVLGNAEGKGYFRHFTTENPSRPLKTMLQTSHGMACGSKMGSSFQNLISIPEFVRHPLSLLISPYFASSKWFRFVFVRWCSRWWCPHCGIMRMTWPMKMWRMRWGRQHWAKFGQTWPNHVETGPFWSRIAPITNSSSSKFQSFWSYSSIF